MTVLSAYGLPGFLVSNFLSGLAFPGPEFAPKAAEINYANERGRPRRIFVHDKPCSE